MDTTGGERRPLVDVTVLGAMRRHARLVAGLVLASVGLALAWAVLRTEVYEATVTVSAPRPVGSVVQTDQQYLDSQVLLLGSREVRDRALDIARETPSGATISRADFATVDGSVEVIPPTVDSSGSYGTTIITLAFTDPDPEVARLGADALAAAYDEVRAAEIVAQAEARLRGIDQAISQAESSDDLPGLRAERAQALIDQGTDLSQEATISAAELPTSPASTSVANLLGVGLAFGLLLGGAAAFVRATRLGHVGEPRVAERVYDAPLLWEEQPAEARRRARAGAASLTEQNRLFARAVAHRLGPDAGPTTIALVATPVHPDRSRVAADLALGLADVASTVVAVDGDGGAMAAALCPVRQEPRARDLAPQPAESLLHPALSVLDLAGGRWAAVLPDDSGLVLLDCPPLSETARGVDLLRECDTAIVLVREEERASDHVEVARWLTLTGTTVLGVVFTPRVRMRPWQRLRPPAGRAPRQPARRPEPSFVAEAASTPTRAGAIGLDRTQPGHVRRTRRLPMWG